MLSHSYCNEHCAVVIITLYQVMVYVSKHVRLCYIDTLINFYCKWGVEQADKQGGVYN